MSNEVSLGEAIRLFLKKSRLKGSMQAMQIQQIWENLMGKTIARYTEKIEIVNHTLIITTAAAPLKQELLYQKANIVVRVNEALGEAVIQEVIIY